MEPFLKSDQYAWKDLNLRFYGLNISSVQSVTLSREVNRVPVYTKDPNYKTVKNGNILYKGTVTLLHSDFQEMVLPKIDLTDLPFIISLTLEKGNTFKSYNIVGCYFTGWDMSYNQGDMFGNITLPFIASNIITV